MKLGSSKLKKRGQTMVEYVILVALLAVASIPVVKVLGNVFRDNLMRSADALTGEDNYEKRGVDQVEAGGRKVLRSLKDFDNQ